MPTPLRFVLFDCLVLMRGNLIWENLVQEGLDQTNDFDSFASEDDFGNFLQTSTRKGSLPPEGMLMADGEPAARAFTSDRRAGSGVHNWLHGEFMEGRSSPIDVGNAQLNLGNIMFWRIHGWIEAKW